MRGFDVVSLFSTDRSVSLRVFSDPSPFGPSFSFILFSSSSSFEGDIVSVSFTSFFSRSKLTFPTYNITNITKKLITK